MGALSCGSGPICRRWAGGEALRDPHDRDDVPITLGWALLASGSLRLGLQHLLMQNGFPLSIKNPKADRSWEGGNSDAGLPYPSSSSLDRLLQPRGARCHFVHDAAVRIEIFDRIHPLSLPLLPAEHMGMQSVWRHPASRLSERAGGVPA